MAGVGEDRRPPEEGILVPNALRLLLVLGLATKVEDGGAHLLDMGIVDVGVQSSGGRR